MDNLTIEVTQDDCDKGTVRSEDKDPICMAVRRTIPKVIDVWCGVATLMLDDVAWFCTDRTARHIERMVNTNQTYPFTARFWR